MAGLTEQGLTIKRLGEVNSDLKQQAQPIFQDLVPPGDVVDTSDSSTLGRLIGLFSLPLADLWEAVQQVYLAFDPNSASGVALDNLVQYGGLTRNPPSPTTATVAIWGDIGTLIDTEKVVRATDNTLYNIASPVALQPVQCIGARITIPQFAAGTYSVFINFGQETKTATTTVQASGSIDLILNALMASLNSEPARVTARIDNGTLVVESKDIFDSMNITTTPNMLITKVKARGEVRAQIVGRKEQDALTINQIATPMLGWDSVINPSAAVPGEDLETDEELRVRFRDSKFLRAVNISDSLYAALLELDGVRYVGIYENETDVANPTYGLPPHSFKVVIEGGLPVEIARAIWRNKPLGISSNGNTFATIFDSQGYARDIYFERPVPQEIYITLNISIDPNVFPADGIDQIKLAVIRYFSDNFQIGDDVIYSRLYTPINSVPGHQVNNLFVGTAPNPTGTASIEIPYNGIATVSMNNIVVNIT